MAKNLLPSSGRRTWFGELHDRFIEMLTELGGGSGNKRLHEAFGWAESTYCFSPVCSSLVTGRCAKGSMNECCGCQLGWLRRRLASTAFKAITTSLKVR